MDQARLIPLEAPFSPAVQQALERRMPRTSGVPPIALFRLLVKDDALSAAMEAMGRFNLRHQPGEYSSIEARDRELIIQRVCVRCGCEYEWGVHVTAFGKLVGMSDAEVRAIAASGQGSAALSERDRLLVGLVDQLHDTGHVDDALWAELAQRWSETQLLQMLVLSGWYHVIAYVANGARLPSEAWAARWPVRDASEFCSRADPRASTAG